MNLKQALHNIKVNGKIYANLKILIFIYLEPWQFESITAEERKKLCILMSSMTFSLIFEWRTPHFHLVWSPENYMSGSIHFIFGKLFPHEFLYFFIWWLLAQAFVNIPSFTTYLHSRVTVGLLGWIPALTGTSHKNHHILEKLENCFPSFWSFHMKSLPHIWLRNIDTITIMFINLMRF